MNGRRPNEVEIPLVPAAAAEGRNKVAEPSDPFMATAVSISTPGYDGLAAMGRAFVEEFAMLGWSRERIARMFAMSRFAAAYAVDRARGPEFIDELITQVLGPPPDADTRTGEER